MALRLFSSTSRLARVYFVHVKVPLNTHTHGLKTRPIMSNYSTFWWIRLTPLKANKYHRIHWKIAALDRARMHTATWNAMIVIVYRIEKSLRPSLSIIVYFDFESAWVMLKLVLRIAVCQITCFIYNFCRADFTPVCMCEMFTENLFAFRRNRAPATDLRAFKTSLNAVHKHIK